MPQNNDLIGVQMPGSFIDQRWGEVRKPRKRPLILQTSPRMASLRQGMCSFLPSCHLHTGGQGSKKRHLNSQTEGQGPFKHLLHMVIITKAMKSKSKKQFQHGVRIGCFSPMLLPALASPSSTNQKNLKTQDPL